MEVEFSRLEDRLTLENRRSVRKYIYNCNEEDYAVIILSAFDEYEGRPLSNAFYLHELTELEAYREGGHEFVEVEANQEFRELRERIYDTDINPHLKAVELHCNYLRSKAQEAGFDLSLGTVIEYDPLTSRQDKYDLFSRNPSLKVIESEKDTAKNFFVSLAKAERGLFDQPFNLANFSMYRDLIFK